MMPPLLIMIAIGMLMIMAMLIADGRRHDHHGTEVREMDAVLYKHAIGARTAYIRSTLSTAFSKKKLSGRNARAT